MKIEEGGRGSEDPYNLSLPHRDDDGARTGANSKMSINENESQHYHASGATGISVKKTLNTGKEANHERNNSSHGLMRPNIGNNAASNTSVLTARRTVDSARGSLQGYEQTSVDNYSSNIPLTQMKGQSIEFEFKKTKDEFEHSPKRKKAFQYDADDNEIEEIDAIEDEVPQIKRAWRADPATDDYKPKGKDAITKVEAVQEITSPLASKSVSVNWRKDKRKLAILKAVFGLAFIVAITVAFSVVFLRIKNDDGIDPYTKTLALDMENLIYFSDKPQSYQAGSYYEQFEQVLPEKFVSKGNPVLTEIEAYYDDYNIEGMQFTFSNGIEEYKTKLFGLNVDRRGLAVDSQVIDIKQPIKSIERLMVNTKTSAEVTKHSGFYIVNMRVGYGGTSDQLGEDDSAYA